MSKRKNKNKKQQKVEQDQPSLGSDPEKAEKYKEQGNQSFIQGNYNKAIEHYQKAIELNPNNAIYLNNAATAHFELLHYEESLQLSSQAIQINPNYVKAYVRNAYSLLEFDQIYKANDIIKEGLAQCGGDNEDLNKLKNLVEEEIRSDTILPLDHPERKRFQVFYKWLEENNQVKLSNLKLKYYSENYRGVHATKRIHNKEMILFIPRSHLITLEMAKETAVSKKIIKHKLDLLSPKHSFLSTFLLQEKRKPDSFWKPYFDILPSDYKSFPIFFTQDELAMLKGSPFLTQIQDKLIDIRKDYDAIIAVAPEFAQNTFNDYCYCRMTACSRIFGLNIDGLKTDAFVPFADMLNHKHPKQTSWQYNNELQGFQIDSLEEIPRGEQVYDSYGRKCNSRFLLNYGFIVHDNDANEVAVKIKFRQNDVLLSLKEKLMQVDKAENKQFRILGCLEEENTLECMGFIRFVEVDKNDDLTNLYNLYETNKQKIDPSSQKGFKPQKTPPFSVDNEIKMLQHLKNVCEYNLRFYPTLYEEDLKLLKDHEGVVNIQEDKLTQEQAAKKLTFNQENCILIRSGEKKILHFFIDFCDLMLPLFSVSQKEARKLAVTQKYLKFSNYINEIIVQLLKKQEKL